MNAFAIDPTTVQDVSSRLPDGRGRLRITPAGMLKETTAQERLMFGARQGIYSFSTDDFVASCDEKLTPSWLHSRAVNGSREFIATWHRRQLSSV